MQFAVEEIAAARELRRLGLPWKPQAGHYVYDETGFCRKGSPFQDHVYFILNYDYFMNQVGGEERFKQIMLWLPTWQDAREVLRSLGVGDDEVSAELQRQRAIENQRELLSLYKMIATRLNSDQEAEEPAVADAAK
jgi:hypothetical protein